MTRRRFPLCLLIALACSGAGSAWTGRAGADDRTAESLYQEGRNAALDKNWALACAKFQESNAREPAPGTLLNLGDCEENRAMYTEAIAHFEAAARLCKPGDERAEYARKRSFALERRAPKLTLRLPFAAPVGTTVERDGAMVAADKLGVPVVVDPGDHVLVVRAPGRAESRGTVRIADGAAREIELTPGAPIPGAGVMAANASDDGRGSSPRASDGGRSPSNSSAFRTAGYVSLGVGAAFVGVGILGGLLTISAKNSADMHCPAAGCDAGGLDAESRGKTWSAISTMGFVAGGVGLAAGAGLLLFGPKGAPAGTLGVQPTLAGAELRWGRTF